MSFGRDGPNHFKSVYEILSEPWILVLIRISVPKSSNSDCLSDLNALLLSFCRKFSIRNLSRYQRCCRHRRNRLANPNRSSLSESGAGMSESFGQIDRKEIHDQRKGWESLVFQASAKSDLETIKKYLTSIFSTQDVSTKLSESPL